MDKMHTFRSGFAISFTDKWENVSAVSVPSNKLWRKAIFLGSFKLNTMDLTFVLNSLLWALPYSFSNAVMKWVQ